LVRRESVISRAVSRRKNADIWSRGVGRFVELCFNVQSTRKKKRRAIVRTMRVKDEQIAALNDVSTNQTGDASLQKQLPETTKTSRRRGSGNPRKPITTKSKTATR